MHFDTKIDWDIITGQYTSFPIQQMYELKESLLKKCFPGIRTQNLYFNTYCGSAQSHGHGRCMIAKVK